MSLIKCTSDFLNVKDFYIYFDNVNGILTPNWEKTITNNKGHESELSLSLSRPKDKTYTYTPNGFKLCTKATP